MAVFIGSGKNGYGQVAEGGKLTREMKDMLAKQYVCVYVDTSKDAGQELADQFRVKQGLVLSDRTGNLQAFRHEGSLPEEHLAHYLKKYADPEVVVNTTETYAQVRESYYPPEAPAVPAAPAYYGSYGGWTGGGFGGFSGGCSS